MAASFRPQTVPGRWTAPAGRGSRTPSMARAPVTIITTKGRAGGSINPPGGAGRAGLTYPLNGSCPCDDHHYNAPRCCKHHLAVALSKRAIQLMAAPAAPVVPVVAPAALASPAVPLPEARSSANVRLHVHGHEVQVTLRDHDEEALLARLEHLLQRYPAPQSPVRQSGSHNAPLQGEREGWCRIHQVQMKENRKDGRMWYSHKTDQGWCKGKGVRHG